MKFGNTIKLCCIYMLIAVLYFIVQKEFLYHTIGCWPAYADGLRIAVWLLIFCCYLAAASIFYKSSNLKKSIIKLFWSLSRSALIGLAVLIETTLLILATPYGDHFHLGYLFC